MRMVLALLAASLLGADGPQPSGGSMITYQYQILDMSGLEWRAALYPQLQPVAHQGSATVWTAPGDVVTRLVEKAGRVVASPRVAANPNMKATVFQNRARHVVRDMSRDSDDRVTTASFSGFAPKIEEATEGYSVAVSGRKIDQGVLAQIAIDDKQIVAVHPVTLAESPGPILSKKNHDEVSITNLKVQIQVPEFARTEVSGEWLIPNDGVLIVSLGAHTVADEQGKAVVHERLALVEAKVSPEGTTALYSAGPARLDSLLGTWRNASRASVLPMPMPMPMPNPGPVPPSRSLPQARDASGEEVPLPPLPEEHAPPTALPGSAEPCATPQHKGPASPASAEPMPLEKSKLPDAKRDSDSKTAGFVCCPALGVTPNASDTDGLKCRAEPGCCESEETCPFANAAAKPAATKTFSFRLPLNGRIEIEINATATPATEVKASARLRSKGE